MTRIRRPTFVALALLVLGLGLPGARADVGLPPEPPTSTGSSTEVELDPPIAGAREIAVAAGGDRVLAITTSSVLAYDLDGDLRARYDAPGPQFGFSDLVLDDLGELAYALSYQGDEVLGFEARTLRLLGRVRLSEEPCAEALTLAGDRVWVAGRCGLASLPLSLEGYPEPVEEPRAVYQAYGKLASAGQHATSLYARGATSEGRAVDRFDLDGTTATLAVRKIDPTANDDQYSPSSFAVSDDGATVADGKRLLDGSTLELRRSLLPPTRLQATFLAGGRHLFGVLATPTSSTAVWSIDHATPAATHGAGQPARLVATNVERTVGFAIAADGSTLHQVQFGGELARLSLDHPMGAGATDVSGRLTLTDGSALDGHAVVVERVGLDGATVLGTPITDPDGHFTIEDPQAGVGAPTYRVRWHGDAAHPDGAFAILLARDGATVVAPPAAPLPPDTTVRLRDVPVRQVLADEAHGRVLVLSWDDAPGNVRVNTHVDLFGIDGTPLGELTTASHPVSMSLTPDGTHLLLLEPTGHQVEILDAATLNPFATLRTAPLTHEPSSVTTVGTDLWISGAGSIPYLRVALASPTESSLSIGPGSWFSPRSIIADRAHPGFAYTTSVPYTTFDRWDLRPDPPVQVANGTVQGGWFAQRPLVGAAPGTPVREVAGTGTIDHDPISLVELGRRSDAAASVGDDEDRESVVTSAAGPDTTRFLALEGQGMRSATVWIGPIQPAVRGHLAVWGSGSQPYRRIPIWDSPNHLAVTGSGSIAFVTTSGSRSLGATGEPSEVRRWLRVIPAPFVDGPDPVVPAPDAPPPPSATSTTTTTTTAPSTTTTSTTAPPPSGPTTLRLSGADRIGTAVTTSQEAWASLGHGGTRPSAGAVIVARSDLFADALAGTPLAHHLDAPILLTASASLDPRTLAEIRRILAPGGSVHLLGGPSAIAPSVATDLAAAGYTVARHAGADRYATAVAVADLLDPSEVLLVTGRNFPDGLSAGAAAARRGAAVLLTDGSTMASATAAFLAAHPGLPATAIGGPAAQAAPGLPAIVGADRYATALAVARAFFPNSVAAAGIASGESFPDALAGGAHIAHLGGPLLLTRSSALPSEVLGYLLANQPARVLVYGGLQAIGSAVTTALP